MGLFLFFSNPPSYSHILTAQAVDDLCVGVGGINQRCPRVRTSSFAIGGERKQTNGMPGSDLQEECSQLYLNAAHLTASSHSNTDRTGVSKNVQS